jgi:transcriptional regulator with XRE-family HTH domain
MDWKNAVAELVGLGVTQPQIADACGCSQSAISQLANGKIKDPRDSIGQALRRLLADKQREAAEKAEASAVPQHGAGAGAATDRRDPAHGNDFPDLDRRAAAGAVGG